MHTREKVRGWAKAQTIVFAGGNIFSIEVTRSFRAIPRALR
jgi:hypothetical protein